MTNLLGRTGLTLAGLHLLSAVTVLADPPRFDDPTITVALPAGWEIEGSYGEYLLTSDQQDAASLLLLAPETHRSLEERLAEIEKQFLATGIIELEASESRVEDDDEIFYRRYRLRMAGTEEEESTLALHQYSFWRAEVQILLQVESPPGSVASEDLFFRIFQTLEIHQAPDPFVFEDPMERG
jgi:hypothetical protein